MDLREQFCKEYYDKNKNYLPEEQRGIKISPFYWKEYALWLEIHLQNTSSNSICGKCRGSGKYMYSINYIGECDECGGEGFA